MKYSIYAQITASKYLGEVEADDEVQAISKAEIEFHNEMHVSVCHQCSKDFEDPEVTSLSAQEAV